MASARLRHSGDGVLVRCRITLVCKIMSNASGSQLQPFSMVAGRVLDGAEMRIIEIVGKGPEGKE